jgi:threonine synthase
MKLVQEVCQKDDIYLANSMNSLRIEGQKTISFEIIQQFNWEVPDFVIVPGGNLGNVSAIGKGFQMFHDLGLIDKLPRLVCAQAERADPLYRSFLNGFKTFEPVQAQTTLASAIQIGDPVSYKKAIRALEAFDGIVENASEAELANAVGRANKTGLLCCPHTGVALAVLEKLVDRGDIKKKDRVVVISTANGLKFTDFLLNYHKDQIKGVQSDFAFSPKESAANYEDVKKIISDRIEV